MKRLVLTGIPHKRGNSNTLASEFIRGADCFVFVSPMYCEFPAFWPENR